VHYFQYDNYNKKVVRKGAKGLKDSKEPSDLVKRNKRLRDKKSPEATMFSTHLKRLKQFTQSSKDLAALDLKSLKRHKSPELGSRVPHLTSTRLK
jgi:hypothetical protein